MGPFLWITKVGPIRAPFVVVVRVRTDSEERYKDAELEDRGSGKRLTCKWSSGTQRRQGNAFLLKLPE